VIGRGVQQRLQALANNRRIMGTARGLLMVHGGAQSAVAAYQAAVAQAQAQLRQQAGAVLAGRVPVAPPGSMPAAAAAAAAAQGVEGGGGGGGRGGSQGLVGLKATSDGVLLPPPERVGAGPSSTPAGAPRRCSAPGATAAAAGAPGAGHPVTSSSSSTQRVAMSADGSAPRAAAAAAPTSDASGLGRRSMGLGGLIRAAQLQQQQQQQGGAAAAAAATASSSSSSSRQRGQQAGAAATAGRAQGQQQQEEVSSGGGGGVAIPQRALRRGLSGPVLRQLAVSMFNDTAAWGQHVAPVKWVAYRGGGSCGGCRPAVWVQGGVEHSMRTVLLCDLQHVKQLMLCILEGDAGPDLTCRCAAHLSMPPRCRARLFILAGTTPRWGWSSHRVLCMPCVQGAVAVPRGTGAAGG
jgi:hypothetical protein